MEQSKKRTLVDIERRLVPLSSKRRRQDETMTPSNPSIATSPPTLIGSPAPVTLSREFHPSTPSYSSSTTSSSASASASALESESESSESDASDSSSDETSDSVDYASSSSVDSRIQQPRSHLPVHLPLMISPSTTSSEASTESESYTSVSTSESISGLLSSSSDDTESSSSSEEEEDGDESVSSSESSESSSESSSADSALSSFTSTHTSQPPTVSVASLTADNLSHLQARLNALLPKLKNANEVLETERDEGRLERWNMENVGEESEARGYIEMNLGLGVLEEKGNSGVGDDEEDAYESEEEKGDGELVGGGEALEDMMGKRRGGKTQKSVGIEEVRN